MRIFRTVSSGLCLFLIFSAGDASAKVIDVTILHTNDLHGHLRGERTDSELNPYGLGGSARLKTLIDRVRATGSNTLLLDGGDSGQGSISYSVDAGVNALKIMSAIGYDAAAVGAHDFLNGPSALAARIEVAQPAFPLLGANKDLGAMPDKSRLAKVLQDYVVFAVGGVRIGVIGVLTENLVAQQYFRPGLITSASVEAARIARALHERNQADVIVLLSHNELATNVKWASQIPWVNLVVSGYSQIKTPAPIAVTNGGQPAYVVEAGHWGQFLGKLILAVDTVSRRVTLKKYQLLPVTADLPEDPKIAAMLAATEQALATKFGKDILHDHVADSIDELPATPGREGALANMLADAYRSVLRTHIALESADLTGSGLVPGRQSTANIYNQAPNIYSPAGLMPFPEYGHTWTLKRLTLTGADLKRLLTTAMLADQLGLQGWLATSGVQLAFSPASNNGAPLLTNILIQGVALNDSGTYSLAVHEGLLLEIEILKRELGLQLDVSHLEESGVETWQALLAFLGRQGVVRASDYESGTRYRSAGADLSFLSTTSRLVPR